MKRFILCFAMVLWTISVSSVKGGEERYCDLNQVIIDNGVATATDIVSLDLTSYDCDVVPKEIAEFTNLIELDISGKYLEEQSSVASLSQLISLNAEGSNLQTIEYLSDSIMILNISKTEVNDLSDLNNMNIIDGQFDYLNIDENSKLILNGLGINYKVIPTIANINVNGDDIGLNINDIKTYEINNEVIVEHNINEQDIIRVFDETTNEEIFLTDNKYNLNANNIYRIEIISGDNTYYYKLNFDYTELKEEPSNIYIPIIDIPNIPIINIEKEETEVVIIDKPEEEIMENEDSETEIIQEVEEETIEEIETSEEPIIKDTADQSPILLQMIMFIFSMVIIYNYLFLVNKYKKL